MLQGAEAQRCAGDPMGAGDVLQLWLQPGSPMQGHQGCAETPPQLQGPSSSAAGLSALGCPCGELSKGLSQASAIIILTDQLFPQACGDLMQQG